MGSAQPARGCRGFSGLVASPGAQGLGGAPPAPRSRGHFDPSTLLSPHTSSDAGNMSAGSARAGTSLEVSKPAAVRVRAPWPVRAARGQQGPPGGRSAHLAAACGSRVRIPSANSFPRSTASLEIKSPPPGLNRRALAPLALAGFQRADRPTPGL